MTIMSTTTTLTSRHGYLNTGSSAGRPRMYTFNSDDITYIHRWVNTYGNPSYCITFARGTFIHDEFDGGELVKADSLYLVDSFLGTSDLGSSPVRVVKRRKDLFNACRWA